MRFSLILAVLVFACSQNVHAQSVTTETLSIWDENGQIDRHLGTQEIRNSRGLVVERILMEGWPKFELLTPNYRYTIEYDDQGREIVYNHHNAWPEDASVSFRNLTEYSDDGRIRIKTNQRGENLDNFYRTIRIEDEQGRFLSSVQEYWLSGEWKTTRFVNQWGRTTSSRMHTRAYTDTSNTRITFLHNGSDWERHDRYHASWHVSERDSVFSQLNQIYVDGEWVNTRWSTQTSSVVDGTSEFIVDNYEWSAGEWIRTRRTKTLQSDDANVQVTLSWLAGEEDEWIPTGMSNVHFGRWGKTMEIGHSWTDDGWREARRQEWIYDGSGKVLEEKIWIRSGELMRLRYETILNYSPVRATDVAVQPEPSPDFFHLSPNPVSNQATLHFRFRGLMPDRFEIYDVLGRIVLSGTGNGYGGLADGHTTDLSALPAGAYFMVLAGDGMHQTAPFIKQ